MITASNSAWLLKAGAMYTSPSAQGVEVWYEGGARWGVGGVGKKKPRAVS